MEINDLSLLRITKVKPWAIYFDYNQKHYFLHGRSEPGEGNEQEIYERVFDSNGRYTLNFVKSKCYVNDNLEWDYIRCNLKHQPKSIVYSQIDKEFFVYKLTKRGFATGMMVQLVSEEERKIADTKMKIREYEDKIRELQKSISSLV